MTFVIDANLDQEMRWGGASLPNDIKLRLSAISALLAIFAPPDERDVEVWALSPVLAARIVGAPGFHPPTMHYGPRPRVDLVWADPDAKRFNDRSFGHDVARRLGCALPGARTIASLDELEEHLAAGGANAGHGGAWVAKARWTSAGRDRCFGSGPALTGDQADLLTGLLARDTVVFEPWLDRVFDVGVCGMIDAERHVSIDPPHRLLTTARGTFRGIGLANHGLEAAEHDILVLTAERVGHELLAAGYRGPFGIDAFVYRDRGGRRQLHPLCEINARHTFGHVARAFDRRIGIATLGFGTRAPGDATMLVAPGGSDRAGAWITSNA